MELVPGGVRHCDKHKTRWDIGRAKRPYVDWHKTRARIMRRDNGTCVYCGGEATEIDHVVASAHGGSDRDDNLVAACHLCNEAKRKHEVAESRLS